MIYSIYFDIYIYIRLLNTNVLHLHLAMFSLYDKYIYDKFNIYWNINETENLYFSKLLV